MDRPIPPSNFKTQDGNVREDLRRLRVYLEQLNDWITANANAGALTQAQADLRYLLRSAGDFGTFTHLSAPASASRVLLEDSAASFAKKYSTLAELGFSSIYGAGSVPLWVPPAARGLTPGTLDDEFDSTTLAAGWTFRDITTGPTIRTPNVGSFNENVSLTGATTVPNVSLHTQGRRSWMQVQTTTTGPAIYDIYKPFTWAAGQVYWCRAARMTRKVGTVPTTGTMALHVWANLAGVPDINNRAYVQWDLVNGTCRWTTIIGGTATNVAFNMAEGQGMPEYAAIVNPAGVLGASATWYGEFFEDGGRRQLPVSPGGSSFAFTPAYIGWRYQCDLAAPSTLAVDFVRETTGHPLLHL
jgi:hypothetical protein